MRTAFHANWLYKHVILLGWHFLHDSTIAGISRKAMCYLKLYSENREWYSWKIHFSTPKTVFDLTLKTFSTYATLTCKSEWRDREKIPKIKTIPVVTQMYNHSLGQRSSSRDSRRFYLGLVNTFRTKLITILRRGHCHWSNRVGLLKSDKQQFHLMSHLPKFMY